jgi:hypothetical protein
MMRYKEVINLLSVTIVEDELGNQRQEEVPRQVFANQWGVSTNEYYEAASQGLKPEKRFEIHTFEYQGESKLSHEGIEYRIIRTEELGEKLRITCEKVIGND